MKNKQPLLITHYLSLITYYLLLITSLSACTHIDLYERVVAVPKQAWQSSYKPPFTFTINDTTATYQLFLILRHTNQYHYNNLWVNVYRKKPDGQTSKVPYELRLADNEGWTATGMDDIYEHRILLAPPPNDSFYFNKKGSYTFTVEHIMREDPLEQVMNVGFRVEKK